MTITALPSDTLSQLQRQAAESARSRGQQTNGTDSSAAPSLPESVVRNQAPAQFRRTEPEARLNELRALREQRLQARDEANSRQFRPDVEPPAALQSNSQQDSARALRRNDDVTTVNEAQRQEDLRTEQRIEQNIEQREQRQDRIERRAESIEEQRARRIRESVEAREIRRRENTQDAVQRRETQQAETEQRIVTEARDRARRLQEEASEAQRRDAERQQERVDAEANEIVQLQLQPDNPATQQPDEGSVQASNESDTEQADGVAYPEQPQTIAQETDTNQDAQTPNELIDILREEADILETLLRQQEIGVTLSGQQLDVELTQVRDSIREEVERNARILQNSLPATSRLGNFIDQIS